MSLEQELSLDLEIEVSLQVEPDASSNDSTLNITTGAANFALVGLSPDHLGQIGRFLLEAEKKLLARKRIIVVPSYTRDYLSGVAILSDWLNGKDFTLRHERAQVNRQDAERDSILEVVVFHDRERKFIVLKYDDHNETWHPDR